MSKAHLENDNKVHQLVENVVDKHKEKKGTVVNVSLDSSIDMLFVLSQVTVKVPLSELLRIPEHRNKAIAWVGGMDKEEKNDNNKKHTPKDNIYDVKDKEREVFVSQIPRMFLENSVNMCLGSVKPFFLSILVNGKTLRNCMIDSVASNTIMPF